MHVPVNVLSEELSAAWRNLSAYEQSTCQVFTIPFRIGISLGNLWATLVHRLARLVHFPWRLLQHLLQQSKRACDRLTNVIDIWLARHLPQHCLHSNPRSGVERAMGKR